MCSPAATTPTDTQLSLHSRATSSPKALLAFTMATQSMPTDQNGQSIGNIVFLCGNAILTATAMHYEAGQDFFF